MTLKLLQWQALINLLWLPEILMILWFLMICLSKIGLINRSGRGGKSIHTTLRILCDLPQKQLLIPEKCQQVERTIFVRPKINKPNIMSLSAPQN